jgi:hypothetical protein
LNLRKFAKQNLRRSRPLKNGKAKTMSSDDYDYIEDPDGNRFVGSPVMRFTVGQCSHCEHRKYSDEDGVTYNDCPLKIRGAFGSWHPPSEIDDWERRCHERVQRPEFAEEDAKLFEEKFPPCA